MGDDATESAPTLALEGQRIGNRYLLIGLIGTGGMGSVYKVRDTELDEDVALKMLDRRLLTDATMVERFRREVKLARRVTHRSVARTFDIGEHQGEKFLTMELLDGDALSDLIAREGAQPVAKIVEIGRAIAEGLAAAHAVGVIHRDLKPENVVLTRDGRVVVADFGLAVAAHAEDSANLTRGFTLGTPAYMAPEQVEGARDLDGRCDLYALGLILYEMATGARAWTGNQAIALAAARLMNPPPDPRKLRPTLPEPLADLIDRLMKRRREERPQDAAEVARLLVEVELPSSASMRTPRPAQPQPVTSGLDSQPGPSKRAAAVLPLSYQGAQEDSYLADALTDDIIDALSVTPGLRVRPRGVVFKLTGSHDPREVGRELGVDVVIEGSVRRAGPQVRVSVRVLGVADGFQIWAQRFDRPEGELLQVGDEITRAIAAALTAREAPPEREAPSDPQVISFYLRARHELRKYWGAHMRRAMELFAEGLAIAPDEPLLVAGHALASTRAWAADGRERAEEIERRVTHARAIASHLGETHVASAFLHLGLGQPERAVLDLRTAITRAPALADAPDVLGRILVEVGATDEGIRRLENAALLDPELEISSRSEIARVQTLLGDHASATVQLARMQPATPGETMYASVTTARVAFWRRDAATLKKLPLSSGPDPSGLIAGLAQIIDTGEATTMSQVLRARAENRSIPLRLRAFSYQLLAEVAGGANDPATILDAVEGAYMNGLFDILWLERCPLLDCARPDPRFAAVSAKVRARAALVLQTWKSA